MIIMNSSLNLKVQVRTLRHLRINNYRISSKTEAQLKARQHKSFCGMGTNPISLSRFGSITGDITQRCPT